MLGAAVVGAVVVGAFVVGFAVVVEAVIVCVGHIRNIKKDHLIRKHINLFLINRLGDGVVVIVTAYLVLDMSMYNLNFSTWRRVSPIVQRICSRAMRIESTFSRLLARRSCIMWVNKPLTRSLCLSQRLIAPCRHPNPAFCST